MNHRSPSRKVANGFACRYDVAKAWCLDLLVVVILVRGTGDYFWEDGLTCGRGRGGAAVARLFFL